MKSKVSTEWFTISHPNRRARLSGNKMSEVKNYSRNKDFHEAIEDIFILLL